MMNTLSLKIASWPIGSGQDTHLDVNALGMAITAPRPRAEGIVHADHGVQFTSWAFTGKIRTAGLMPSVGTIGDCYDNSMMETFWSSIQIELLHRKKWRTRTDLANAMFDYMQIFHNRQRRHSKLGFTTPIEHQLRFTTTPIPA